MLARTLVNVRASDHAEPFYLRGHWNWPGHGGPGSFCGLNDLARMEDENYESKQDRLIEQRRPIKRFLLNNSALYGLFRNVRGIYRARAADLIHNTTGYPDAEWPAPTPPARRASG